MTQFDFTLIGGGIVGVATALTLKQLYPDLNVALIEFWYTYHCNNKKTDHLGWICQVPDGSFENLMHGHDADL
ncbi:MAG: hypothetical protein KOO65_10665 [Desulfobacterales bacterium]|nr:hypothetical protein [Desulfobacterales bacterium]